MIRLAPTGFAQQDGGAVTFGADVSLTGVAISAIGAEVTVQSETQTYLSPAGFAQQTRNFIASVGNINVTLVGAQVQAQAQALLGAELEVIPDSAYVTSYAASIQIDADEGVQIVNPDAETPSLSNTELDDITGFRILPGRGVRDWKGYRTRKRSADMRPLQENLTYRGIDRSQRGPQSPELEDTFLSGGALLLEDGSGFVIYEEGGAIGVD